MNRGPVRTWLIQPSPRQEDRGIADGRVRMHPAPMACASRHAGTNHAGTTVVTLWPRKRGCGGMPGDLIVRVVATSA